MNESFWPALLDLILGFGWDVHVETQIVDILREHGYPTNPTPSNRTLIELNFTPPPPPPLQIGQFSALDFFSDGSFYLPSTPGHATGHISALARTTSNPDTPIGGDLAHDGAEMRPSAYLPIPVPTLCRLGLEERNLPN
ncbi:hypothetical protein B0T14DRAFT_568400 [Immersiella caudata]|uniref:Uncharacterized protein n=1 Tax=Immersiella caudata TaxID=314043 RepID=A0AA39WK07_9PEZI|nr:hypothetical protein B0T14DRAFT_568400 [Immersiella caudata]